MPYCPNCATEIPSSETRCRACGADFGLNSSWRPLEKPSPQSVTNRRRRPIFGIASIALPLLSVGVILFVLPTATHLVVGALYWYLSVALTVLGAMALVVALFRTERWIAAQLIGGLMTVGMLVFYYKPREVVSYLRDLFQ